MKIAFIGAGSYIFARKLVIDLATFDDLPPIELALMDIDASRLETTEMLVNKVISQQKRQISVTKTLDRRQALDGADFVFAMYEPNGLEARKREVQVCIDHRVPMAIGDTLGPSGVFKGIRTGILALSVARDMEQMCPDALFLNYVNPMAVNCWVVNAMTDVRSVGMCHGLEHTRVLLAGFLEIPADELYLRGWGINHMLWILEMKHNGQDMYPRLREILPSVREQDPVRFALMDAAGYFVTESSYHSAEYVPYFREWFKPLAVFDHEDPSFNFGMGGWGGQIIEPSEPPAGRVEQKIPLNWDIYLYEKHWAKNWDKQKQQLLDETSVPIALSEEYGMRIVHSVITDTARTMSLNVANKGYIPNLPTGATVELPVKVDKDGLHPDTVDPLPEPCASLCRRNIEVHSQIVEAIANEDARAAFNAVLLDPLAGACLDPAGMRSLFNDLVERDREWLPEWLIR